jgi:hypothetical protein
MIDTRVVSQELQDKILEQVRKGQEQFRKGQEQVRKGQQTMAEAVKGWTAAAQSIAPQLPAAAWTARLPKPEELVAGAQEFYGQLLAAQKKSSEKLLAAQKKFAEEALDAVKPLLALTGATQAQPGRKPTAAADSAGTAKTAGTGSKPAGPGSKPAGARKASTTKK